MKAQTQRLPANSRISQQSQERPVNPHKAYIFQHRDGRGALLIGSSNFTEAGFLRNVEWNYFSSDEVNLPFDGGAPFDAVLTEFMRH